MSPKSDHGHQPLSPSPELPDVHSLPPPPPPPEEPLPAPGSVALKSSASAAVPSLTPAAAPMRASASTGAAVPQVLITTAPLAKPSPPKGTSGRPQPVDRQVLMKKAGLQLSLEALAAVKDVGLVLDAPEREGKLLVQQPVRSRSGLIRVGE